jgi:hypothetical protein
MKIRNLTKSCILSTEFISPPNLVRDKGIYSIRAGSMLTSAGPVPHADDVDHNSVEEVEIGPAGRTEQGGTEDAAVLDPIRPHYIISDAVSMELFTFHMTQ